MKTTRLEAFSDGVLAIIIAAGLYVFVALLWFIPDPRIEREIEKREE